MAFFPDLSPYSYDDREPRPEILNVGWLSKDHSFTRGSVPDAFLLALRRLAESPTELYRGKHPCEFCVPPDHLKSGNERFNWSWERAGNGEIRVPTDSGITYAAPVLIVHYVSEHQYQPPQEFIEAVLHFHNANAALQRTGSASLRLSLSFGSLGGVEIAMPFTRRSCLLVLLASCVLGSQRVGSMLAADVPVEIAAPSTFNGSKAGETREVVGIQLCWCPPGKFVMGSPRNEPERRPDEDQVEVTLTKGFWMAKFEATQGQWKRVMGKLPGPLTAELPEGDDFPVGNVNFAETEAFCQKLTELGHQSGKLQKDWEFRLPTEAQWEYACRAGTKTATSFGDRLSSKQANFKGKPYNGAEPGPSLSRAAKVGSYSANAWDLHDMHGNIFEWCRDWYHGRPPGGRDPDLYSAKDSATKSADGSVSRVRRGGCWADEGWPCRSAFRLRFEPERRYDHIGFRVVVVQARKRNTK